MKVTLFKDVFSILLLAMAVGLDAFSISLGIGTQRLRLRQLLLVSCLFGISHLLMPLIGLILGKQLSPQIEEYTLFLSGLLLLFIGLHMLFSTFKQKIPRLMAQLSYPHFAVLAFTTSIDSFPVGVSLGLSEARIILSLMLFGLTTMFLTMLGLLIGRKAHYLFGIYSEMFGAIVLCSLGLYLLFGP